MTFSPYFPYGGDTRISSAVIESTINSFERMLSDFSFPLSYVLVEITKNKVGLRPAYSSLARFARLRRLGLLVDGSKVPNGRPPQRYGVP